MLPELTWANTLILAVIYSLTYNCLPILFSGKTQFLASARTHSQMLATWMIQVAVLSALLVLLQPAAFSYTWFVLVGFLGLVGLSLFSLPNIADKESSYSVVKIATLYVISVALNATLLTF